MKKLFLYVTSLLSLFLLINQAIQAWSGDSSRLTWIIIGLCYAYSIVGLIVVAFKQETRTFGESDPIKVYSFPKYYKVARLGLIVFLSVPICIMTVLYKHQKDACDKIIILVADFYGERPENYQITEEVISKLKDSLSSYIDTEVIALDKPITEQKGREEAKKIGESRCAKIVIWGRYTIEDKDIKLTVHIENLDSRYIAIGNSLTYSSLAKLDGFQFQMAYPSEIKALALSIVGISRYTAGKYEEALEIFRIALDENYIPKDLNSLKASLLFFRGNSHSILDNIDLAIKDFTSCIEIAPYFALAYNNRGMINRGIRERIKDCEKAKELAPDAIYPYVNLGGFYIEVKDMAKASENLSKAVEIDPNFTSAHYNRGVLNLVTKKPNLAVEDFSFVIKNHRKDDLKEKSYRSTITYSYMLRGDSYLDAGKPQEAFSDYNSSLNESPDCAECYNHIGIAYLRTKDYEKARAAFLKTLELDPNHSLAHFNLGQIHLEVGRLDEAIKENLIVLDKDPNFSDAYGKLGLLYVFKGEHQRAIDYASKGVTIDPQNANPYYSLGLAYYELNEYQRSLENLSQSITLNPAFSYFFSKRARTLNVLKRYTEAIEDCEKAMALDSANAEAFLFRGTAYGLLGDKNKAKTDLNKVFDLTRNTELVWGAYFQLFFIGERPNRPLIFTN